MIKPPTHAFAWRLTVTDDHIDVQNHVSNVAVVDWINTSAWQHSIAAGFDTARYTQLGGMWVVRRHEISYHAPALLGDAIECTTWIQTMTKVTAERHHRIHRPADGQLIAEAINLWAWVDRATARPRRIPADLREAFNAAKLIP